MQRNPSPKKIADPSCALPCKKMESDDGSSPVCVNLNVSGDVAPDAPSSAPPVAAELLQPCAAMPLFPHGQAVELPSPAQNDVTPQPCHSAMHSETVFAAS